MRVQNPPSRGHTRDVGLGFDFDWSSVGEFFKQAAPVATQLYAQKAQLDMQRKAAEQQAKMQAAQNAVLSAQYAQALPYTGPGYAQQPGRMYAGGSAGGLQLTTGRGGGIMDGLPSWALPAAIGGGVLLVALMMRR